MKRLEPGETLIERIEKLEAEVERLTMANQMLIRDEKTAAQNVAMLRAEIERLRDGVYIKDVHIERKVIE